MALPVLKLFPRPRELTLRGGWLAVPTPPHPTATFLKGLPTTMSEAQSALDSAGEGACRIVHKPERGPEGYHIEILASGIRLNAGDAHGVLYGAQTLRQIAEQYPDELPHLEITDSPDLPVRGFMLDISRTRVPTQSELLQLIAALGKLRANQLQLYIEHTFAFPGHEDAWKDASPLTPAEIRELDEACAQLGIELVPNLNTFGHMERWLRHPRYRAMAECPEGWIHPLTGQFKEFPGTLRPDQASIDFAGTLLDDYLPNFRSRQVNIGGDEPWELGQGFSKQAVAERGKHRVYLDHLKKLCALGRDRGHTVQFWGDILLEDLALAQDAPANTVPVVWGYDAGHPFNEQCGRLHELGRTYLVAPGTSAWQSFTGRLDNALTNQAEAVGAAIRHGARGILLTTWGDNGHHQPWPTAWLPIASGLAQAWGFPANHKTDFVAGVATLGGLSPIEAAKATAALEHLGRLDGIIKKAFRNKSLSWEFLTAKPAALAIAVTDVPAEEMSASIAHTEEGRRLAGLLSDANLRDEIILGADLALAGLQRASGHALGAAERHRLLVEYNRVWAMRSRPGGLGESSQGLFGN
jgi:hexosaminidase